MGDIHIVMHDRSGKAHALALPARYFPELGGDDHLMLVSTDELVTNQHINPCLWNRELVCMSDVADQGDAIRLPFLPRPKSGGIPRIQFVVDREPSTIAAPAGKALLGEIHRAHTTSHIHSMPSELTAAAMHRRLHVGIDALRHLPSCTSDAPRSLANAHGTVPCPHCTEANATHLSHRGSKYEASYPGRLIHADIVGPFVRTRFGNFQYMLVLVDDHSRFKQVYFLKKKSEAPEKIKTFLAEFNAVVSHAQGAPARVMGTLHSDNAGEFLSLAFTEFLDQEGIAHTMCPPHVHSLNGVAERAIRSIMEVVRSNHVASGAPLGFWNFAAQHACDVLNRTTGPPDSDKTCYEMLTGEAPRIMDILPYGCRAFAVKPRVQYSKTTIDARAWVGMNLGRDPKRPGSYLAWIPTTQRIITTSDMYFYESLMPWRPKGDQDLGHGLPSPHADDGAQPPGIPAVPGAPPPVHDTVPSRPPLTRPAPSSRRVLILYSGPYHRPDGMRIFLEQRGLDVTMIDNGSDGGGEAHDILKGQLFETLLRQAAQGDFLAVFAAPPCSTFSISRYVKHPQAKDGGPPPVRSRKHPEGRPDVPLAHAKELRESTEIIRRTVAILVAAWDAGAEFIVENPPDRGDRSEQHLFMHADHSSIWHLPELKLLKGRSGGKLITFPQCAFESPYQKYTTLLCSPGFEPMLGSLNGLRCTHSKHAKKAGGELDNDGHFTSHESAAYPANFNAHVAHCIAGLAARNITHAPPSSTPTAPYKPMTEDDDVETVADRPMRPLARQPPSPTQMPPLTPAPAARGGARPTSTVRGGSIKWRDSDIRSISQEIIDTVPVLPNQSTSPPLSAELDEGDDAAQASTESTKPRARIPRELKALRTHGNPWGAAYLTLSARKDVQRNGSAFLAANLQDPSNRKDAMRRDRKGWLVAESAELRNHLDNGSWEWVERSSVPRDRPLVKLTWAYKVKRSGKLKARLCVQGCSQIPGVDYHQTFCSTMRTSSLRALSAIAAKMDLNMRRWDFVAAYLQGSLESDEVLYCSLPPGAAEDHWPNFNHSKAPATLVGKDGMPLVCKVVKPIYGMAQAGRRWQRTLYPWLKSQGFKQSASDTSVFHKRETVQTPKGPREELLVCGVYVDDVYALSSHDDELSLYRRFTTELEKQWEVEDEGEIHDLLGIEISREGNAVVLRQSAYIQKMLDTFCEGKVPQRFQASTPPCGDELALRVADALADSAERDPALLKRYRALVGSLLYASTGTRPDIAFAVGLLCRAMGKPTLDLEESALRVLHYLGRHADVGLTYEAEQRPMAGMSDSDWAVQHSTTGWVFKYCRAAISWSSKKQQTIALSSCEAEIVALTDAAKEGVALHNFLDDLGLSSDKPTAVATDNTGAQALSYNPEFHDRTKHILRKHFWIRELVEDHRIEVPYVNTLENQADFFTKALPARRFFDMRDRIMNHDSRRSSRH